MPVSVREHAETTLLIALRNDLGLRGVRIGCNIGECGSCTVIVDGEAVRSCQIPLSEVEGAAITTPEGLGTPENLHRVQQAFLENQAAQCGYCINGIEMTVAALLENPSGRFDSIEAALEEHICRCGAHPRILRAIRQLAGDADPPPEPSSLQLVSAEPPQPGTQDGVSPVASDPGRVEDRLRLRSDGGIDALTGKVELGQGVEIALQQIAAAGLGIPIEQIVLAPVATDTSPDDGRTTASASMEVGGTRMAMAAAAFRRLLLERAGERAGLDGLPEELSIDVDRVLGVSGELIATFRQLHDLGPLTGEITAEDLPLWTGEPVGSPIPRTDLRRKVTGAAGFVHDLDLPGMLHARVVLPPTYGAKLESIDLEVGRRHPEVVRVHRHGQIVIVVAQREESATRAVRSLAASARWSDPGIEDAVVPAALRDLPAETHVARRDDGVTAAMSSGRTLRAAYSKPYQAHAPIAPSCAVALDGADELTVWSHSQGIHWLRQELIKLLDLVPARNVTVRHMAGPGCYGLNCADDVAGLAAVAATTVPGSPVRLQFTMEDEFAWDPFGPAMVADIEAALDDSGRITAWRHEIRTDAHNARPDGSGTRLMAAWLGEAPSDVPWGGPTEGGARNAVPIYDLPLMECVALHVNGGLRTGELRALGAFFNVFAAESFIDELAELAGQDPVAFRLAHITDPRARQVLQAAAESADWEPHVGPSGMGRGVAIARYKGSKAYVAQVVHVAFDDADGPQPLEVITVCDTGTVINPDGARNQLDGGTLQSLSRTLHEQVSADRTGVLSRSWLDYPVLGFSHVPVLRTILLDRSGFPPLGVGEASLGPTSAAFVNALDDATGIRMRDLPITTERLQQRLIHMSPDDATRVRLD